MSTVLSWAAAVWRRVFCGQKSEHVLVAKESRDADEADIIHGGERA